MIMHSASATPSFSLAIPTPSQTPPSRMIKRQLGRFGGMMDGVLNVLEPSPSLEASPLISGSYVVTPVPSVTPSSSFTVGRKRHVDGENA